MTEVVVTAPARLHFGMLDPAGLGPRRFGGCGVGVEYPRVVVRLALGPGRDVTARGSQAERAAEFTRRAAVAFGHRGGVEIDVLEAIPPHIGLGSGTKLGLAIARGMAELTGHQAEPAQLAEASGRGARSSIGCWTFAAPGLVVEAGVLEGGSISPLVARHPMPPRWRCVLAVPRGGEGLSGDPEERFFEHLHEQATGEPRVSRLLLTALLPGLVAGGHRGVRGRAHRDPARDRVDLRRPAGWRVSSARGPRGPGAAGPRGQGGGTELVGPHRLRDRRRPRARRRAWPIGCASRSVRPTMSASSTSIGEGHG